MTGVLNFKYKRLLLGLMKRYENSKQKAKELMQIGDINSYMKEIIKSERAIEQAELIVESQCS
jgi:hypothetical protein